jgi:hypothetical protein
MVGRRLRAAAELAAPLYPAPEYAALLFPFLKIITPKNP